MTNLSYCVMVLAVGDISYKKHAKEVLQHYFKAHSIPHVFIEEVPKNIDLKDSHPSWWKLLAHSILPNIDFIICWDLDLLPSTATVNVISDFNMNRLCMAVDSQRTAKGVPCKSPAKKVKGYWACSSSAWPPSWLQMRPM